MDNPPAFIHLFSRKFWRILKIDYPSQIIRIRLGAKTGRCSIWMDNSSDFICLFRGILKTINSSKTDYSSWIHTRRIKSSHFSTHPRPQCLLAFQRTLGTKSLERERVRCIVGFVEQNMAPKVKGLTRKDKDKSQRREKTYKKNTMSENESFIFATVLSSLDERGLHVYVTLSYVLPCPKAVVAAFFQSNTPNRRKECLISRIFSTKTFFAIKNR